ncbi:MAG: MFS transporter [Nocardioides sp.]
MTQGDSDDTTMHTGQVTKDPLWRNRDFMLLWIGMTTSAIGSSMSSFIFPIVGYALTGSPAQAALTGTAHLLGRVLSGLPAGALVDRRNRRTVMAWSTAAGAALYASLALAVSVSQLTLFHLLAVAAATGAASAFIDPAESAAVRQVVPTHHLPAALSQTEARQYAATLVGPPLGGLLYAAARWAPFVADAASYLVASLTALSMRADLSVRAPKGDRTRVRDDILEGLRFVWSRPFLRAVGLSGMVVNAAVAAMFLVLTLKLLKAGVPEALIGVAMSVGSVAGLVGAVIAPSLIRRLPTGRLVVFAALLIVVGLTPLAFTDNPILVGILLGIAFIGLPALNAGTYSYLIAITPDHLQGRVNAGLGFAATAAQPIGPVLGGVLMSWLGAREAMLVTAVLVIAGVGMLIANRDVRRLPTPDRWEQTVEPSDAR